MALRRSADTRRRTRPGGLPGPGPRRPADDRASLPARRADLAPTTAERDWSSVEDALRLGPPCPVPLELLPTYYEAAQVMELNRVPFLLGGGLMVSLYGRSRPTKDIDFFVRPDAKNRALSVLNAEGFFTFETEKAWLLKAEKNGAPVDLIVHSTGAPDLDDEAIAHAGTVYLAGYPFRGFGPEDLLIRKIYSWLEGRPDWWDAVSIVACSADRIDWEYFVRRVPDYNPARALSFVLFAHAYFHDERIPWWVAQRIGRPFFRDGETPPRGRER